MAQKGGFLLYVVFASSTLSRSMYLKQHKIDLLGPTPRALCALSADPSHCRMSQRWDFPQFCIGTACPSSSFFALVSFHCSPAPLLTTSSSPMPGCRDTEAHIRFDLDNPHNEVTPCNRTSSIFCFARQSPADDVISSNG